MLTVGVSLWLGIAKQKTDSKAALANADSAFRDDLFELNARYEKELEKKEDQIRLRDERLDKRNDQLAQAQLVIGTQLEKITDLTLTVKQLEYKVSELTEELAKFNKKVFYVRDQRRVDDDTKTEVK